MILSWTNKLLETYDACSSLVGEYKNGNILLPIGHLIQRAQIELTIDEEGSFINAVILEQEAADTVLPVSEDSASRGNGISPHPLHDKLLYIAKDYSKYVDPLRSKHHDAYMEQLYQWVTSPYTNATIQAIYAYLLKGTVIEDLIRCRILEEQDGFLSNKVKFQKTIPQSEAFVRFRVYSPNLRKAPWEDKELFQSFIDYYQSLHKDEIGLCCITGKQMYCTDKHPSKLRYSSDKAKLISTNDASGFTFRGRLANKENVLSIGYETSQKIHNALRWLIQEQGYLKDGFAVVVWNVENKPVYNNIFDRLEDEDDEVDLNGLYAKDVVQMIDGYERKLEPRDDVMIMMLESATEGRLSILGYQELKASQYYGNLKNWYENCQWMQYRKPRCITTPTVNDIILSVYGTYRDKLMVVDKKMEKQYKKDILPCIFFGKDIPLNLIRAAYRNALHLAKLDLLQFQKCVGVLCALVRKKSIENNKKQKGKGAIWSMDIIENKENGLESTAYLIGRLMAVYFEMEHYALYNIEEERTTNAMKYLEKCRKSPWKTLMIMDEKVRPYVEKLKYRKTSLERDKQDISVELSKRPEAKTLKNLDYDFILGFECQRHYYEKTKLEKNEKIKEEQKND